MAGGLLDWWTNAAAAAALGPEWLASVLTVATAPASTSIGNHATIGEAEAAEGVPARPSTLISLIQCKNTSLATKFLDNIGVPYHALECEHGTHCVLAFFHNGMGSTSNGLCSNLM